MYWYFGRYNQVTHNEFLWPIYIAKVVIINYYDIKIHSMLRSGKILQGTPFFNTLRVLFFDICNKN